MRRIRRYLTARGQPIQPYDTHPNKGRRLSVQFNQALWEKLTRESKQKSLPISLIVRDRLEASYNGQTTQEQERQV